MGKGSAPRPLSVSGQEYRAKFDAIFEAKETRIMSYGCDSCNERYEELEGALACCDGKAYVDARATVQLYEPTSDTE